MMFKTVSFNIFEEDLQDIVYGSTPALKADDKIPANKTVEISRQSREIIIKPLNDGRLDREKPSPENFKNRR
jgi:hypothetical protein